MHIDNIDKETLILGERPTQRLYDTTLTSEAKNQLSFQYQVKHFV